jgi:hypothetical protein
VKYLDRDGLKFLKFWWDHIGERLPEDKLVPFKGFSYEVVDVNPTTKVILIVMPEPLEVGEVYFLGLISKPEKRFAWVKLPTTRILTLVRREDGVEFGDLTPRALFVPQPEEVEATIESFKEAVLRLAGE